MKIEWQQDLATGDEKIDRHHKELLAKVQQLVNACKEGREKTAVLQMLDYLANYVDSHFAEEERFLELYRVANTMQHLKQHADFRRSLDKLRADCVKEGASLAVVTNSLKLTYLWLRDHIQADGQDDDSGKAGCCCVTGLRLTVWQSCYRLFPHG